MPDLRTQLKIAADPPAAPRTDPIELRRLGARRRRVRRAATATVTLVVLAVLAAGIGTLTGRLTTTARLADDAGVAIPADATPTDLSGIIVGAVSEVDDGLVAFGQRAVEDVPKPPSLGTGVALFSPDARRDAGLMMIGLEFTPDADLESGLGPLPHRAARVWRSTDGLAWDAIATKGLGGDIVFTSAVWSGEEYVAIGQPSPDRDGRTSDPIRTWRSTDGKVWRRGEALPTDDSLTAVMPRAATSGQRGVVLLGDPDGMPTSQVYLGDPDLGGLTAGPQLEGDVGDISWIGDRFVAQATHFESETYSTSVLFSTDGTLWDERPLWGTGRSTNTTSSRSDRSTVATSRL